MTAPPQKPLSRAAHRAPLYRRIAASLREQIASQVYPVGATLPTEHQLSARLKVSRATVVAALDQLEDLGLVYRRPRTGTQVVSRFPLRNNIEEGSVFHDWARFGVEYIFEVLRKDRVALPSAARTRAGPRPWLLLSGRRVRPRSEKPLCVVDVYVHPDYAEIAPDVSRRPPRIFSLIEARYGVLIHTVEQELRAAVPKPAIAKRLGLAPGETAVEILRWYRGPRDKLIEFTLDVHPAARFSYRTRVHRGPTDGDF